MSWSLDRFLSGLIAQTQLGTRMKDKPAKGDNKLFFGCMIEAYSTITRTVNSLQHYQTGMVHVFQVYSEGL